MSEEIDKQPAEQAIPSPLSGVAPPVEHRWQKGQSGNPAGRPPAAGATLREWINTMQGWSEEELLKVATNAAEPIAKRRAAERWLSTDPKDFDRIMDRTVGRPKTSIDLTTGDEPLSAGHALTRQMMSDPETHAAFAKIVEKMSGSAPDARTTD